MVFKLMPLASGHTQSQAGSGCPECIMMFARTACSNGASCSAWVSDAQRGVRRGQRRKGKATAGPDWADFEAKKRFRCAVSVTAPHKDPDRISPVSPISP